MVFTCSGVRNVLKTGSRSRRARSHSRGSCRGVLDREVLDQRMDASIGRRIGRCRRGADRLQAPHGAGLHDRAAAARSLHGLRRRLRDEKLALEDDAQETIVFIFGDIEEWLRPEDAGVVEQDVQTAKAIERCLYRCFSCRWQGNVACMGDSTLSGRVDLLSCGLSFSGIASDDDDGTAFRDESGRHFLAYARTTPRDDRDLVLKTHDNSPKLFYLSID